jgi:hypothetical protein
MITEIALYIGLATAHTYVAPCPSIKCEPINETNYLTALQVNGFTAGRMINSYNVESFLFGYTHTHSNWQIGLVASTGYTETPMKDYTVAGLMLYPTLAYSLPLNEHVALTAITTGIVNNIGLTITF